MKRKIREGVKWLGLKLKAPTRKVLDTSAFLSVIAWAMLAGYWLNAPTAHADVVPQQITHALPPVMARISKCESPTGQYAKDGQVARHVNKDGTVDIGAYMINSVHNKEASKMGYDLSREDDNKAFAAWLYANRGTGDWYSSARCWN